MSLTIFLGHTPEKRSIDLDSDITSALEKGFKYLIPIWKLKLEYRVLISIWVILIYVITSVVTFTMSKKCAKCEKTVYPTEELKCLDKVGNLNNGGFCWRLIRAPSSCFRLYNINTLDTDTEIVIGNSFISDTIWFEVDIESIIFRCTATVEKWAGPIFKPCCNISNFWLMDLVFWCNDVWMFILLNKDVKTILLN